MIDATAKIAASTRNITDCIVSGRVEGTAEAATSALSVPRFSQAVQWTGAPIDVLKIVNAASATTSATPHQNRAGNFGRDFAPVIRKCYSGAMI
jgi:hypothetical protein